MKTSLFGALALASIVAAYGCSANNATPPPDDTEDQLVGFRGNVDHAGIVEATTMMLVKAPVALNLGALDPFNTADPFHIDAGKFKDTFVANLAKYDAADGVVGWTPAQTEAWTSRMAAGNYLVVDTSKPCDFAAPHTYLEIERAGLTGKEHQTCGGRMPNEDALDVTLNFLIRGPGASAEDDEAITDGVDQATSRSHATFPYLAEANGI
jgi:hypothetical protein